MVEHPDHNKLACGIGLVCNDVTIQHFEHLYSLAKRLVTWLSLPAARKNAITFRGSICASRLRANSRVPHEMDF